MKPATEQLLATLELLTDDLKFEVPRETDVWHYITPFSWDIEAQGELNALNLLKFKGVVQLTDAEVAIANWQAIEQQGTPTEDGHYAPERDERENILDEATQAKRIAAYQSLLQLLKAELQELQVYSFSCSQSYSYRDGTYTSYAIVGRTQDNDWICLASTVPEQTELKEQEISRSSDTELSTSKPLGVHTSEIVSRIEEILTELPPLEIYGYYRGLYNYTYEHKIIYKAAATRELAFENAADLVEIDQFKGFYLDRRKARARYSKKHLRVSRQRTEHAKRLARHVCKSNDLVAYEDLRVGNMLKNHCLAKSISDASWYEFRQWLEHFAAKFGRVAVAVSPQYTSQECSQCKVIVKKSLSTLIPRLRVWTGSAKGLECGYQYFAKGKV